MNTESQDACCYFEGTVAEMFQSIGVLYNTKDTTEKIREDIIVHLKAVLGRIVKRCQDAYLDAGYKDEEGIFDMLYRELEDPNYIYRCLAVERST